MPKKSTTALNPKAAICKELNCFEPPSTKGFCRLHFLKVLAGKSQGDAVPHGKLEVVKERRNTHRFRGLEPNQLDEESLSGVVEHVGELDTDIEDIDIDPNSGRKLKKTG